MEIAKENKYSQAKKHTFCLAMLSKYNDELHWHNVAQYESTGRKGARAFVDESECKEGSIYMHKNGNIIVQCYLFAQGAFVKKDKQTAITLAEEQVSQALVERNAKKAAVPTTVRADEPTPLHEQAYNEGVAEWKKRRAKMEEASDEWYLSGNLRDVLIVEAQDRLAKANPAAWAREEKVIAQRDYEVNEADRFRDEQHAL